MLYVDEGWQIYRMYASGPSPGHTPSCHLFSCWAWNSASEFSTQCSNKSLLIDGSWHMRSHINSFSSSDINCKFLVGQGPRMLARYCSEPKVNNEILLELGKAFHEPGSISGTLRKLHIGDPTRWASPWVEILPWRRMRRTVQESLEWILPSLTDICSLISENLIQQQDVFSQGTPPFITVLSPLQGGSPWKWRLMHWGRTWDRKGLLTVTPLMTEIIQH